MAVFTPTYFNKDKETWLTTISDYNFGTLLIPSFNPDNPNDVKTVRTPFVLHDDNTLSLHVNSENPIWKVIENFEKRNGDEKREESGAPVVVMFDGPHHYISPSWFHSEVTHPGTRVPTWDYVSVTIKGRAHIISDTPEKIDILSQLVCKHEKGRKPWRLENLEHGRLLKMIGIEGSFKMSQNGSIADRDSISNSLARVGTDDAIATGFLIKNNAHATPMMALRERMRENSRSRRGIDREHKKEENQTYRDIMVGACLVAVPVILYYFAKKIWK